MVSVPVVYSWSNLEIPPYYTWNQALYATWQFLLNPPMVKARQTTAQTLTTSVMTPLNFQVEEVDTHGMHSTVTNPSRFTAKVPGYYVGYAGASFAGGTTGTRQCGVMMNNTGLQLNREQNAGTAQLIMKGISFGPWYFNGTTDYIQVVAYQITGANLSTLVTSDEYCSEFYMRWWSA